MEFLQHKITAPSSSTRRSTTTMFVVLGTALAALAVPQAAAFSNPALPTTRTVSIAESRLFQEAPKYSKHHGILQQSECVGKGSYLLTIDYKDADATNDYPDYNAGHVLALEIQPPSSDTTETQSSKDSPSSEMTTMTEKTKKDLENNGGWLRGPYTVSFGYGGDDSKRNGFKVLVKEVGYKSHVLATSKPGTPVLFGGKFKVPISEGIVAASEASKNIEEGDDEPLPSYGETKRVVLISSGVGVGPCMGAIEELLESTDASAIDSIDLIASFRTKEEICMDAVLDKLLQTTTSADPAKPTVNWNPIITSQDGRISSKGPEVLRDSYLRSERTVVGSAVTNTHYHIIGNGQMVSEWKEGLTKAGVPPARVTVEAYFNHSAKPDPCAIDAISEAIQGLEKDPAKKAAAEERNEAAISS